MSVIGLAILSACVEMARPNETKLLPKQFEEMIPYPYGEDTVSPKVLMLLSVILPIGVFALLALARWRQKGVGIELRVTLHAFATAYLLTSIVTSFGKRFIGRPRPNFLARTGSYLGDDGIWHIANNNLDAWQSWPSGHASQSFVGLTFFSLWLFRTLCCHWRYESVERGGVLSRFNGIFVSEERAGEIRDANVRVHAPRRNLAPLVLLSTGPLWIALWISMTRVRDFHHNYDDVLAGGLIGFTLAYFSFRTLYVARASEWSDLKLKMPPQVQPVPGDLPYGLDAMPGSGKHVASESVGPASTTDVDLESGRMVRLHQHLSSGLPVGPSMSYSYASPSIASPSE
jgi:diacylglycerol diphosphate phosphatase/phosphatidate phosphatase